MAAIVIMLAGSSLKNDYVLTSTAELERLHMEELRRQEEENKKLQGMDESERAEYLRRKEQEEEDRRTKDEERRRKEEEAALLAAEEAKLQADLLARYELFVCLPPSTRTTTDLHTILCISTIKTCILFIQS